MNSTDRMLLLNKYSRQTENIYCTFSAEKNIDIITKIFTLKFNNDALVDAYVNGDPIVDHPGCRLSDFLDNEFRQLMDYGDDKMKATHVKDMPFYAESTELTGNSDNALRVDGGSDRCR